MTDTNKPDEPDRPSGGQPYQLPTPDLGVFGSETPDESGQQPTEEQPRGSMRYQDASTTRPRPPSLAEQRARQQAEEEEAERELAAQVEAGRRATIRRRVLIGGGVTVGIAALVGAWYLLSPSDVTARCTVDSNGADQGTVVQDQYCDESYVTSHGGHISNGIVFLPIPGGGYRQYHYYYGGTGSIGQRATGGSYNPPSNATIRTNSGKTISRGGFGVSGSHGGSGGEEGGGHSGGS